MFGWAQSSFLPIGVDIGTRSVKLLQLRRRRGQLVLHAAARAEIAPVEAGAERGDSITEALRKVIAGGFVGRNCVSSLPAKQFHSRSIRLPQMPENERAKAVMFEAKDRFSFDFEQGRLEHFLAGEARRGTEIRDELLLFAAAGDVLRGHVESFTRAGLDLTAIDLQPCAMHRALARVLPPDPGGLQAVIDLGAGGTQLFMMQDDRLVFYKYIEIGADTLNRAVAQKLGVDVTQAQQMVMRSPGADDPDESPQLTQAVVDATRPALEELSRELDMCLRYYVVTFRGRRPENAFFVGGLAGSTWIADSVGQTLGARLHQAAPLAAIEQDTALVDPRQAGPWITAVGLALYSLPERAEAAA